MNLKTASQTLHGEAQRFNCRNEKKTHSSDWMGTLKCFHLGLEFVLSDKTHVWRLLYATKMLKMFWGLVEKVLKETDLNL